MFFIPELLIGGLFLFLYCVFVLAKDDFLLLRKNVNLEQLFNAAFIGFCVSLFFSRVFFVLQHIKSDYLNPLVFFLFPYFPGLSITGGIVGALLLVWIYAKRKKLPFGRVFDIFSLSFFFTWSMCLLVEFGLSWFMTGRPIILLFAGSVAFLGLFILFLRLFTLGKLKDSTTGFIGFACFATLEFLLGMGLRGPKNFTVLSTENILQIFLLLLFLALYIQQETLGGFYKSMKRR